MALINCKECGQSVSDQAVTCPGCGVRVKPKSHLSRWVLLGVMGAACLFVAYAVVQGNDPKVQAMRADRDAYRLCMDTVKASMSNPTVKQACENMRKDFWAKYNREP